MVQNNVWVVTEETPISAVIKKDPRYVQQILIRWEQLTVGQLSLNIASSVVAGYLKASYEDALTVKVGGLLF